MNSNLDWAQSYAHSAITDLGGSAKHAERAAERDCLEHAEKLRELASQLWAMESFARTIEAEFAGIAAVLRGSRER